MNKFYKQTKQNLSSHFFIIMFFVSQGSRLYLSGGTMRNNESLFNNLKYKKVNENIANTI